MQIIIPTIPDVHKQWFDRGARGQPVEERAVWHPPVIDNGLQLAQTPASPGHRISHKEAAAMSFVKVSAIAGVLTVLFSTPPGLCQDRPAKDLVVYAPDVLGVDRLFMIVLSVPIDSPQLEVTVSPPDVATLFDRTPVPAKADERRYYFRTLKPAREAKVTLAHPEGDLTVPIEIWSFDDLREFRKLKGTQLPRRWPLGEVLPELKEARTITTQAELDTARKRGPGRGAHWLKKSDDEIWAMQPDSTIPRWHWVNVTHGCPIHGTEIYKSRAFYPWGKDASLPYRWKN